MPARRSQTVRYLQTSDGVRLAWAESGRGAPMVKAANWLSHLEHDLESPVWRHWIELFSDHFRFIRYDERGCGMSGGENADLSFERRVDDFAALIDAANITDPITLLGISQGAAICIAYAVRHPERVARMILYGGYARGFAHAADSPEKTQWNAIIDLARVSWGKDNPAFRSVFTSPFIPGGTDEQLRWYNEVCRRATSGATAARLLQASAAIDVRELLPRVHVPTLVLHAKDDGVVPVHGGRRLAAEIPDARFIELESRNHILLESEPAWQRFREAVLEFTGRTDATNDDAFRTLSPRQREILALLVDGLGNAAISERLGISEKTVRNQVSSLFDKLGVWSRAQAIVFARDRNFSG